MSKSLGGIYRFKCNNSSCGQHPFEQFTFDSGADSVTCPSCGGSTHRLVKESHNAEAPDLYSEAVGVHPSQIADAQKMFPHHRFAPDGRMIFSSQKEKDRVLRDLGYVDHAD